MSSFQRLAAVVAFGLCGLTPCLAAAAPSTPSPADAVMRIGTQSLSAQDYRALALADLPQHADPAVAADPGFVRTFADRLLWVQQAHRAQLQDDPVVAARIRQATDGILANAMQARARASAHIETAQVQAQFAAHPHDYDEVRLSHLFVALQPQSDARRGTALSDAQALARAQQLKRQLDAGTPFEQLAQRESDDATTAGEGGELSPIFLRNVADVFVPAVQGLGVGQVSAPVRGPDGYHLIRLDARRVATLDSARGQIEVQLRDQAAAAVLEQLRQGNP
ncbi:peptidylprolyl isomerase, partial [Xanthomonas maliensis]|uniref:peptidylprolyl isomerase n=1 Tax=Xanthomonas maliensis TaxID=1321368 RepID=UPI0003B5DF11